MSRITPVFMIVLVMLAGLLPASADNTWQAAINNEQLAISFRLEGQRGNTLNVSIQRTAGDLIPFLVFYNRTTEEFVARTGGETDEDRIVYSYTFPQTATFDLIVTRENVESGITQGEFTLSLDGAALEGVYLVDQNLEELASLVDNPAPSQDYVLPPETAPAAIVFSQRTFEGQVNSEHLREDYLISLKAGQTISVLMEQIEGDLQPNAVMYDAAEEVYFARGVGETRAVFNHTAEADGWYRLICTRLDFADGSTEGRYQLTLTIE